MTTLQNKLPSLSPRLLKICNLVRDNSRPCEIGCDHAFVSIYLINSGKVSSAFACDLNTKPLEKGRENARIYGAQNITFLQSDGLENVPLCDVTDIVISGMGGELIASILEKNPPLAHRLILAPNTKHELLRQFLFQHNFNIISEEIITEKNRIYPVIVAEHTPTKLSFSKKDIYLGKSRCLIYRDYVLRKLNAKKDKDFDLIKEIENESF